MGADYWKPRKLVPCELNASRGLWDVIYEALTPPQKSAKNDSHRLQEEKITDFHQF